MSRDLRQYARATNIRLLLGFILLLFLVGGGLIYWIWGPGAALMGVLCLFAGLVPLTIIWLVLVGIEWIVQRERDK